MCKKKIKRVKLSFYFFKEPKPQKIYDFGPVMHVENFLDCIHIFLNHSDQICSLLLK